MPILEFFQWSLLNSKYLTLDFISKYQQWVKVLMQLKETMFGYSKKCWLCPIIKHHAGYVSSNIPTSTRQRDIFQCNSISKKKKKNNFLIGNLLFILSHIYVYLQQHWNEVNKKTLKGQLKYTKTWKTYNI